MSDMSEGPPIKCPKCGNMLESVMVVDTYQRKRDKEGKWRDSSFLENEIICPICNNNLEDKRGYHLRVGGKMLERKGDPWSCLHYSEDWSEYRHTGFISCECARIDDLPEELWDDIGECGPGCPLYEPAVWCRECERAWKVNDPNKETQDMIAFIKKNNMCPECLDQYHEWQRQQEEET